MFPSGYVWYSIGGIGLAEGLVNSWNGLTGVVTVDTDDLPEGPTNKYFADALAQAAVVTQTITSGVLITAPSEDAVFNALAGKANTVHTHVAADITDYNTAFDSRFNTDFAAKTTDDLAEGLTNFYYHTSLFNTDFGTKTTDDLAEGVTNLYYTDTRARAAFTAGTNISISLAGVIDNTYTYTLPIASAGTLGGIKVGSGLSIDGFGVLSALGAVTSVFGRTGAVTAQSGDYDTDLVTEGVTNLYFTTTRARNAISATSPVAYSNVTGIISMAAATALVDGYLTAADWSTFNGKQDPITTGNITETVSSILSITGGTGAIIGSGVTIQVAVANTTQAGYLTSTDWNTFNNKQSALTFGTISSPNSAITVTNGNNATVGPNTTIDITNASGSTNGLLTSTDWNTFNNKGSVSSVALSMPGIFTVSGSPVTTTGTLTATLANQNANVVFAGPSSGGAAAPTFRALVANDIPNITSLNTGTGSNNQVLTYVSGVATWSNSQAGGAGGLQWVEGAPAPAATVENNVQIFSYQATLTQKLYALLKVPNSYAQGQINLRLDVYSGDSSGTNKVKTVATLIRQGVDTMSSTTNQRTSTSTVTLSGGTVNIPQAVTQDLTSTSGQINGVNVSAGDYILIELSRDSSDTATGDMKIPVFGIDLTFS